MNWDPLFCKLKDDQVILSDEYSALRKSLNIVCLQDQYLSPVKIECEGKGDEMPTLKAIIKDGEAKISGEWNKTMKIPKETVTSAAFYRIVTQLPRVQGATIDFALEASEMLKRDYIVKVIGKETIIIDLENLSEWGCDNGTIILGLRRWNLTSRFDGWTQTDGSTNG